MNNKQQLTKVSVLIDKLNYLNDNLDFNSLKINDLDFKLLKNYAFELSQLLNGVSDEAPLTSQNQVVKEQLFHNIPKPAQEPVAEIPNKPIIEQAKPIEPPVIQTAQKLQPDPEVNKIVPETASLNIEPDKNVTENIFDTVKAIKKQHHVEEPEVIKPSTVQFKNKPIEEAKELVSEKKEDTKSFDFMPSRLKEEKVKKVVEEEVVFEEEAEDNENSSLNDRFKKEEESLGAKIKVGSNRNFKELIDINDRFLFIQSLFGGSYLAFEEAVKQINKIDSYSEALDYVDYKLKGTYDWSADSTEVTKFLNILERSYA